MATGTLVGSNGDGTREKHRWSENKVYTRKIHHHKNSKIIPQQQEQPPQQEQQQPPSSSQTLATEDANNNSSSQQQQEQGSTTRLDAAVSDDSSNHLPKIDNLDNHDDVAPPEENGAVSRSDTEENENENENKNGAVSRSDTNHVIINLSSRSKEEVRELRERLFSELEQVRGMLKTLESKEVGLNGYTHPQLSGDDAEVLVNGMEPAVYNGDATVETDHDLVHNQNGGPRTMGTDVVENGHIGGLSRIRSDVVDNGGFGVMDSGVFGNGGGRRMNYDVVDNGMNYDVVDNGGFRRMYSEPVDSGGFKRTNSRVVENGGFRRKNFHVAVPENGHGYGQYGGSDVVEKRTPKANHYYKNSGFIVGKEKFPPQESNKRQKIAKKNGVGGGRNYASVSSIRYSKIFQSCSSLLAKLQKHKFAWVFNKPVDVKGLGLHDYFLIIKHPMDLGTVKSKLSTNKYNSPREFADDIRLTFDNAMTYNPKGQDVHHMAVVMSKIFEDDWAEMDNEYDLDSWYEDERDEILPTPVVRRAPPPPHPPAPQEVVSFERPQHVAYKPKPAISVPPSRTPAPKKPKAKDLNKRDMTYDEKQRLSHNLQNLPLEKLDNVVQIIKRRTSSYSQNDDEIELDMDCLDTETLWELDRFVVNFKKSLSKNKRKAELALQRQQAEGNYHERSQASAMEGMPRENKADEKPAQEEKRGDNASRSSSSSSSSSDSGSSSSDSDSDSSSGSDAGNSPRS